jgi:hypothetical protein
MRYRQHYRIFIVLFCLIVTFGIVSSVCADAGFKAIHRPSLDISRSKGAIKIDGQLNDPGWQQAATIDQFVENSPGDQIEPPVKTKAFLTYDNENLYVAAICYDNPKDIRASWCERDQIYGDDNIGFFFDTYGDAAWGYTLNVNPHGIQADALYSAETGEDATFDLIWESAGQLTDSGYQVEMAIPFSSLRFPRKDIQVWKVEFWRHHRRAAHHQISWAAYDRNESCWACQWGTITGIENVVPGRGVEIMPSVIGYQSGALSGRGDTLAPFKFNNNDLDGQLSLNTKYAVSSNFTIEATINPDFSQIEADAEQIDVNSTTALSFPEKRPFFQEGSDLFRSSLSTPVYTRSINDPNFGVKATARWGKWNLAYLGANDENSPLMIPFEESSSDFMPVGESFTNILRMKTTIGTNSRIGAFVTDRRLKDGGSGSLYSIDGSFRLLKWAQLNLQTLLTHTAEPDNLTLSAEYVDNDFKFDGKHTAGLDGESFWGDGQIAVMELNARNLYGNITYYQISKTFRADNGYEPVNNRRLLSTIWNYDFRFDKGFLMDIFPQVEFGSYWNMDGMRKSKWYRLNMMNSFRAAQLSTHIQYSQTSQRYAGKEFDNVWNWHFCGNGFPSRLISFDFGLNYGHQIAYGRAIMSKLHNHFVSIDLRPVERLLLENEVDYMKANSLDSNSELFDGYVFGSRISYQFSPRLSLRVLIQYNNFSESWGIDPLISYRINSFTHFYIGSTYNYMKKCGLNEDETLIVADDPDADCHDANLLTGRQYFMKLQYLFQL